MINNYDADDANAGVTWGTAGVASGWSNDTTCARLVRELFGHAYSWATDSWFSQEFGSTSPDTQQLRTHMAAAHHFDRRDLTPAAARHSSGSHGRLTAQPHQACTSIQAL